MLSSLEIQKLIVPLRIGAEKSEHEKLQDIEINITINFAKTPEACFNDRISDTICYASLVEKINDFCANKTFHLIENFAFLLYQRLQKELLSYEDILILQICKTPPIASIKGKCCFTIKNDKGIKELA